MHINQFKIGDIVKAKKLLKQSILYGIVGKIINVATFKNSVDILYRSDEVLYKVDFRKLGKYTFTECYLITVSDLEAMQFLLEENI